MLIWTFENVGNFVRVWLNYTQKRRDERLNCIGDLSLEHQTECFSQQSAGLRGDGVVISWQRGWTCGHYLVDIKDARPQEHWHTLFLSLFVTFLFFYLYHVSYIICSDFPYIVDHLFSLTVSNQPSLYYVLDLYAACYVYTLLNISLEFVSSLLRWRETWAKSQTCLFIGQFI